MDIENIKKLIDKDIDNKGVNKDFIINEVCKDKKQLLFFLENADEIYFRYLLDCFTEIVLKLYSKSFVEDLKEAVNSRNYYSNLSNINYNILLQINDRAND